MFAMTVTTGASLQATPGLRLPPGSVKVRVLDGGRPAAGVPIVIHVVEGGAIFPAGSLSNQWPTSSLVVRTDAAGDAMLPELQLGHEPVANRLLFQGDHASAVVSVVTSYNQTQILCTNPTSAATAGLCRDIVAYQLRVEDQGFPGAPVEGIAVEVEILSGGGWLLLGNDLSRAALFETQAGAVLVTHELSSREEQTILRASLPFAPAVLPLSLTSSAHRPRLLSAGTASRVDRLDTNANGRLSKMVRLDTVDATADVALWGPPYVQGIEVLAREKAGGGATVEPEVVSAGVRMDWQGAASFAVRTPYRSLGAFDVQYELWLPDYPDDPVRTEVVPSQDDYQGGTVTTNQPDPTHLTFIQSNDGGTRDDTHGMRIAGVVGDVQYVGPDASSPRPFEFDLVAYPLPDPTRQRLKKSQVRIKVRMSPDNSVDDDPSSPPGNVPGTIGTTPAGGSPEIVSPGPQSAGQSTHYTVWFRSNPQNFDHFLEVTAKVTISEDSGGTWVDTDYDTTLLVRALFPRPRLRFARKAGPGFVPIDDTAVLPATVVDDAGTVVAADPRSEVFVELRCHDIGPAVTVSVTAGGNTKDVPLTRQTTGSTGSYTLYRSDPLICHLEDPAAFGRTAGFTSPAGQVLLHAVPGRPLEAWVGSGLPTNPANLTFWTAARPVAFLNLVHPAVGSFAPDGLTAAVPRPSIVLNSANQASDLFSVQVSPSSVVTVRLTGSVRDPLADVTEYGHANIPTITVGTQQVQLTNGSDTKTTLRPFAWRGEFTVDIPLEPGLNVIPMQATNLLGGTTVRLVHIELLDQRNDFANPVASAMQARVQVLSEPDRRAAPAVALAHYWAPHATGTGSLATSALLDLASITAGAAAATLQVALTRAAPSLENTYRSRPVMLVSDDVDPQAMAAARAAGAPVLSHVPGSRLRLKGSVSHPAGGRDFQTVASSRRVDARVLVDDGTGTFVEADRVEVGDRFTIEIQARAAQPPTVYQTIVTSTSRLGHPLEGTSRELIASFGPGPDPHWLRFAGYEDHGNIVPAAWITAISRNAPDPSPMPGLRVLGGGAIVVGGNLARPGRCLWPVAHEPMRQVIGARPVVPRSPRGTSALAGACDSVVVGTGELVLQEKDASLRGRGIELSFARTYESFCDYDGPIGHNWNHGLNTWIRRVNNDVLMFVGGDGETHLFLRRPTGGFTTPTGMYVTLEEPNAYLLRLRWPHGVVQLFVAHGADEPDLLSLVRTYDRCRNRVALRYDQSGILIAADDPLDQRLAIRLDDLHRVEAVGDQTGRLWRYSYHDGTGAGAAGDLRVVTAPVVTTPHAPFPSGKTHTFAYEVDPSGPRRHKVKERQDPKGIAVAIASALAVARGLPPTPLLPPPLAVTYTPEGRVDHQDFGRGSYIFFYAGSTTTVTNRRGKVREYHFPFAGSTLVESLAEVDQGRRVWTTYRYNSQDELRLIRSPLGAETETVYTDSVADPRNRGNVTDIIRRPATGRPTDVLDTSGQSNYGVDPPLRTPTELRWTYVPETEFQSVQSATDPLRRVTEYVYDYQAGGRHDGNLVELRQTPTTVGVLGSGPQVRRTTWRYDNFGQPIESIDVSGVRTAYRYYPAAAPNGGSGATPSAAVDAPSGHLADKTIDAGPAAPNRSRALGPVRPAVARFGYDERGTPAWLEDARGHRTRLDHNELGQLVLRADTEGLVETLHHDENDRLVRRDVLVKDLGFPAGATAAPDHTVTHLYDHDRLGNTVKVVVDSTGLALTTLVEHDEEENVWFVRSPNVSSTRTPDTQAFTEHTYDDRGRLESTTKAPGVAPAMKVTFTYDDDNLPSTRTDAHGLSATFEHDGWGRRIKEIDGEGNERRMYFDAAGQPTKTEVYGRIDASRHGLLSEVLFYLDEGGRHAAQVEKVFRWEPNQRLDIGRRVTEYRRDAGGNVASTKSTRGPSATCRFNALGLPIRVSTALTGVVTFGYDPTGNLETMTFPAPRMAPAPASITLARTYDKVGRLLSEQVPGGGLSQRRFDTLGRLRLAIDPVGNRTYQVWDDAGRLVEVRRELGLMGRPSTPLQSVEVSRFEYDDNCNLTGEIDPNQVYAQSHTYGSHDERLTTQMPGDAFPTLGRDDNPGSEVYSFAYLANGLLHTMTAPGGLVVTHGYDRAGRIASRRVSASPSVTPAPSLVGTTSQTYTHDGRSRCIASTDVEAGGTTTVERAYDSLDSLWSDIQRVPFVAGAGAGAATATHTVAGTLHELSYPSGTAVDYEFDGRGRMVSAERVAQYVYDRHYLSRRRNPATNLSLEVNHDAAGRVAKYLHQKLRPQPGGTFVAAGTLDGEEFVRWEDTGMPAIVLDARTGKARYHRYDSLLRTLVTYDGILPADLAKRLPRIGNAMSWTTYDNRGNAKELRAGSVVRVDPTGIRIVTSRYGDRTFNSVNQVGQSVERVDPTSGVMMTALANLVWIVSSGSLSIYRTDVMKYDRRGNLIEDPRRRYSYDAFNRLATATDKNTGAVTSFHHDALGRRVAKGNTRFAYFGSRLVEELDGAGVWRKRHIHGAEGVLATDLVTGGQTRRLFLHENRAGGILFVTDSTGAVVERYEYDPLANPRRLDAAGSQLAFDYTANLFLHQGQYFDPETGLYHVGSRDFHPELQSMLQRDPVALDDSLNAYAYAAHNLQAFHDPSGNLAFLIPWVVAGIKGLLIGLAIGLAFEGVHQLVKIAEGGQESFDISAWIRCGLTVALFGTLIGVCPALAWPLGLAAGTLTLAYAGREYRRGNTATALFDVATVLVPLAAHPAVRVQLGRFSAAVRSAYAADAQPFWRFWADFRGVREQRIAELRLASVRTHIGGFEPWKVMEYIGNAVSSDEVITKQLEIVFEVPWDLHTKTYGEARGFIRRGDNRALTLLEVRGRDVRLGEVPEYWREVVPGPLGDPRLKLGSPLRVAGHHTRFREWIATGGASPSTTSTGMIQTGPFQLVEFQGWRHAWEV